MLGDIKKTTKRNLLKGIPWRFGPNWPGERCEAKTRKGTPCQRPAKLPVGRCRLHGGASTGPRTAEGLKRLADSKTKHGRYTKIEREKANLALRYLSLIKGKDDITQKSSHNLFKHTELGKFGVRF